ncbi:MAG: radical SAM protein [Candidatus Omnitrophota bacterium]
MDKDLLLIHCPLASVDLPPMGVAYIAAFAQAQGVVCDILDLNALLHIRGTEKQKCLWDAENYNHWIDEGLFDAIKDVLKEPVESWINYVLKQGYRTVGFSLTGSNLLFSIWLSQCLKASDASICIVYGGPTVHFKHINLDPFRFLSSVTTGELLVNEKMVDYIVLGEGEKAIVDIVQAVKAGKPVDNPSVVTTTCKKLSNKLSYVDRLDDLPFPAWEKLSLNQYTVREELPILFSRGCVNHCAFCNDWLIWNGKYRCRSAKNIFLEMKTMSRRYGKRSFRCNDLMFNGNLNMLDELSGLLIASGLEVNWGGQGYIRKDMTQQLLDKMYKAGLRDIVFGVESLSDHVLVKMRKPFTFDDVLLVLKRTKAAGIRTHINLIVGFPGETEEDHLLTQERLGVLSPVLDTVANINCCRLMADAPIESCFDQFGIVCADKPNMCEAWGTIDGLNNLDIRQQRMDEMEHAVARSGIKRVIEPLKAPALSQGHGWMVICGHVWRVLLWLIAAVLLLKFVLRVLHSK